MPPAHSAASGEGMPGIRNATVEKIAINAVMAGALPTYMPALIAAVQTVSDPKWISTIL